MPHAMTLRLTSEQAADLEALAQVEGIPVSEAVRQAIDARIQARRSDAGFQKRLAAHRERYAAVLKRLA